MAAEALLVGQAGDAHDHRVAVLARGEELQAGRLAAELVLGIVQVGEILDFRYGQQARDPGAEAEPEDRLLVQQGIEDPAAAEPPGQPAGYAVDTALAADILA